MRNSILIGILLGGSLLGAPACTGDADDDETVADDDVIGADVDLEAAVEDPAIAASDPAADPAADPAVAAPPSTCGSGYICLYSQPNYKGYVYKYKSPGCHNLPPPIDNKCSSYYNWYPKTYYLYVGYGCTGAKLTVPPGAQAPALGAAADDKVSSTCTGACP